MSKDNQPEDLAGASGEAFSKRQEEQMKSLVASAVAEALTTHSNEKDKQSKSGEREWRLV